MRSSLKWFIGSILCLLLALLPGEHAISGDVLPALPVAPLPQMRATRARISIDLAGPLPRSPDMAMTYRIQYPSVDKGYVLDLAAKLGLHGKAESRSESALVRDGSRALEVYAKTGAFWYKDTDVLWADAHPGSLPDAASGTKLANALMERWGLLPEGMLFESIGHSEITIYDVATGQSETHKTDLHVNYGLSIGGIPVEGPGGKAKVYLGDGYRVIGMYWAGFQAISHKAYPIISADQAMAKLNEIGIATAVRGPIRASVSDVSLVYFAGSGLVQQDYLEPVYRFRGIIEGQEESRPFKEYVPAMVEKYRKVRSVLEDTVGNLPELDLREEDAKE